MEKKFEITNRSIIFNFSAAYVKNETEVLSSEAFKAIFTRYIEHVKEVENSNLLEILNLVENPLQTLTALFKLLLSFEITIREIKPSAGAGFLVALTGDILTMPGLPKEPAGSKMDVVDGKIVGLF